jgi:pimeloyl-ACP methyl ester carboxylesterase
MVEPSEIRFRAGDVTLAGTLTLPDDDSRVAWVVLVTGWLPRDRDGAWDRDRHPGWFAPETDAGPGLFARLAGALAALGVATLRYDPRGCGESGGTWETADLFTRIDDARDAIGAMRSRRELDLRRTALVGHGLGAVVAMSAAISDPAIGAIGLLGATARSARDVIRRGVAERGRTGVDRQHPLVAALDRNAEDIIERAERREASMPLRVGSEDVELGLAGVEQAIHTPALALATMVHRPVVLAHGLADARVDPDESRLLRGILEAAGNEPVLHELAGAAHDLAGASDADLARVAADLAERMEPRELPPVLVAIEEMGSGR